MSKISFKLLLGTKKFEIPTRFSQLNNVSSDIYDTLIFSPDHQYTVKSKVSEEVFQSFIKSWISGDTPNIHIDNYFEYSQLSNEFNLFTDLLEQKKEEFGSHLNQFNTDEDSSQPNSNSTDMSFEDEVNKLQEIINGQNDKIKDISFELKTMKINEQKQFTEIENSLSSQSKRIENFKEKQESDISMIKSKQTDQFENIKSTLKDQNKELVKMKYSHAQDIDKIKKQINDKNRQITKSSKVNNKKDIKFTKKDHIKRNKGKSVDILFDSTEKGRFKGIINYLTDECSGNVHINGAVEITSSSVLRERHPLNLQLPPFLSLNENEDYNPYNAAELDDKKSCFESDNIPNSWICYDFIDAKVKPNAYSIRTYLNGNSHMKSWRFEGSMDKAIWDLLDEQSDNYSINECGKSNTFILSNINNYYRYLRIKQTDSNVQDTDIMNISAIEFFGSLLE